MGRLTDDMTRLVGEIHAARDGRCRLMRDLAHATVETRRAVAHLRGSFAADSAGARAAWLGATAPVSPRAGVPETAAPSGRVVEAERGEVLREAAEERTRLEAEGVEAEREEVLREAAEERTRLEAERQARDKAQMARKARRRRRPR